MAEIIRFKEVKLEGGWLMIRPEREDLGLAMALVRKMKNKLYQLEVKEYRKSRSNEANAYAWVLMHKLGKKMGIKAVEVYRQYIPDVGDNFTAMSVMEKDVQRFTKAWESNGVGWVVEDLGPSRTPGCRTLMAYHGSSTFDTAQMSRLIDMIVQDCKALDIETLTPEKLAMMKESWK